MEKQYLIVHIYTNTEPASFLVKEKMVRELTEEYDDRKAYIFEWDFEKIKSCLKEVELKIVEKSNENIKR